MAHTTKYIVELDQDEIWRIGVACKHLAAEYENKRPYISRYSNDLATRFIEMAGNLASGANVASECYRIIEEAGNLPTYTIENNS